MKQCAKFLAVTIVVTLLNLPGGGPKKIKLFSAGKLYPRIDYLKTCPYNRDENMQLQNVTVKKFGTHDYALSGILRLHRLCSIKKTIIKINRCPSSAETTCELFQTWTFGEESCKTLMTRDMPWSTLLETVKPQPRCPVVKDDYYFTNSTVSMKSLEDLPFPFENNFWKVIIEPYDGDGLFGCLQILGTAVRSRS